MVDMVQEGGGGYGGYGPGGGGYGQGGGGRGGQGGGICFILFSISQRYNKRKENDNFETGLKLFNIFQPIENV